MHEFNSNEREVARCHRYCLDASPVNGCDVFAYGATRARFDSSCIESEFDELDEIMNALQEKLDEIQRKGDPSELGLAVDEHGIIIDA